MPTLIVLCFRPRALLPSCRFPPDQSPARDRRRSLEPGRSSPTLLPRTLTHFCIPCHRLCRERASGTTKVPCSQRLPFLVGQFSVSRRPIATGRSHTKRGFPGSGGCGGIDRASPQCAHIAILKTSLCSGDAPQRKPPFAPDAEDSKVSPGQGSLSELHSMVDRVDRTAPLMKSSRR